MIRAGLIGVGKMGISHFAILGANHNVDVVAISDSARYVTSTLRKHMGVSIYDDYREMLDRAQLDCVVVATPTSSHFEIVANALERNLHVFVEKPLALRPEESSDLSRLAARANRVNQVGYHNRFIGTFREARRLVRSGALGEVYHISGSAFGQVVVRPKVGATWRSRKSEGGGCLHDYASHVIDLMHFVVGPPETVSSAQMRRIYSADVEDAVYATFLYPGGASGYLEANWSDETHRKMSTTLTINGTHGKIIADRQECKVYLKEGAGVDSYPEGWTVRYITDLQAPVDYYLRGEEYTAQLDAFVGSVKEGKPGEGSTFADAFETDRVIAQVMRVAQGPGVR